MVGVFVEWARRTISSVLVRTHPDPACLSNLKKGFSGRISRRMYDGQGDRAPNPARRSGEDPSRDYGPECQRCMSDGLLRDLEHC